MLLLAAALLAAAAADQLNATAEAFPDQTNETNPASAYTHPDVTELESMQPASSNNTDFQTLDSPVTVQKVLAKPFCLCQESSRGDHYFCVASYDSLLICNGSCEAACRVKGAAGHMCHGKRSVKTVQRVCAMTQGCRFEGCR